MKTKRMFLGLSIFGVAILGAFASSFQTNFHYRSVESDPNSICNMVNVGCDQQGTVQCRVLLPEGVKSVWGTTCQTAIFHSEDEILEPNE